MGLWALSGNKGRRHPEAPMPARPGRPRLLAHCDVIMPASHCVDWWPRARDAPSLPRGMSVTNLNC